MEEKINREIRNYQENVWQGLTWRQLGCGAAAIVLSVMIYFNFIDTLGQSIVSWLCILAGAPFVLLGWFRWHGMSAEKALLVWIKHLLTPKELVYRSTNYTAIYFQPLLHRLEKEETNGSEHNAANDGKP